MQFVARADDRPALIIDNKEGGSGAGPMQLVLIGVAGCTAMDVIHVMRKKRAKVTDFDVNISGERAETHPKRFIRIHIEYVLYGAGIRSKDVEQAISLSATKYCSAMASLNADLDHSYRIVEDKQSVVHVNTPHT
jgi:putative redox protein